MNAFSGLLFLSVSAVLVSCFQLKFHLYGVTCLNVIAMKLIVLLHSTLASMHFIVMIHVVVPMTKLQCFQVALPTVDSD